MLVVLYNQQIEDSKTLSCLVKIKKDYQNCHLVIWNNGPHCLKNKDCDQFTTLGLTYQLIETLENRPLSHIYNQFIQANNADKYIILDHDSSLSFEYWDSLNATDNLLLLPKITSHGKMCSPSKLPQNGHKYKTKQKFSAITSGMILSNELTNIVKAKYNDIFDESYAFYGIDTSFMLRMKYLSLCDQISVIDGFEHSLSKNEQELEETKLFRAREMAISTALTTRYYPSYSSIRRFIKSILRSIRKKNDYPIGEMFIALISGKHPKCKD